MDVPLRDWTVSLNCIGVLWKCECYGGSYVLVSWTLALQWASGVCMSEWEQVPPSGKNTIWHKHQWSQGPLITHSVTLGGPHPFWGHWFLPWQEEVLITSSWGVKVKGGVRSVCSQFQNQKITCLSPLGIHGPVVQHVADFLISQPRVEESWLSVEGLSWVPHLWNGQMSMKLTVLQAQKTHLTQGFPSGAWRFGQLDLCREQSIRKRQEVPEMEGQGAASWLRGGWEKRCLMD